MNDHNASDIQAEVEAGELSRVVIPADWRDTMSPEDLATGISAAIRAALPPEPLPTPVSTAPVRSDLDIDGLRAVMDMQHQWRRELVKLQERIASGELDSGVPSEVVDERERLSVTFDAGRFEAVHFHPVWIADASLQAIVDAVLEVTAGLELVPQPHRAEAGRALDALDAEIQEFTS